MALEEVQWLCEVSARFISGQEPMTHSDHQCSNALSKVNVVPEVLRRAGPAAGRSMTRGTRGAEITMSDEMKAEQFSNVSGMEAHELVEGPGAWGRGQGRC